MREIKFRGKRLDNGEWVKGDLLQYESGEAAILKHFSKHGKECSEMLNRDKVDPATVGQYTGLKDRNGKEIYEGDIFIESERLPGDDIPREVTFEHGAFRCAYTKKHWAKGYNNVPFHFLYELKDGNIEVIGNIYDNLMLEGKK